MPVAQIVTVAGRALIAMLFILAGVAKVIGPRPFLDHMAQHRVPGFLLPAVYALEIGAGLALLIGWQPRYSAGLLGVFCIATALVFHLNFADHAERSLFFKDLAIAGGLICIAATA
jgi:putative oxidoreductase